MKKIIAIMLAALMLLSLAACGKTTSQNQDTSADTVSGDQTASTADNEAAASTAGKIAVVFATGGLGDKTYNDSLYAGVKNVCDTMGLQFDYSEPMDAAEYEPLLRGYAETGEYALIISLGYSQGSRRRRQCGRRGGRHGRRSDVLRARRGPVSDGERRRG